MPNNSRPPSAVRAVILGHVRGLAACSLVVGFWGLLLGQRCLIQWPLWPLDAFVLGLTALAGYGVGLIAGADAAGEHGREEQKGGE